MLSVNLTNEEVVIEMTGLDGVWSMRREVRFPRSAVSKAYLKPKGMSSPMWRTPGTHVPRIIKAGVYRGKGRREFWFTRYKSEAVVFDLEGEEFDRVVVDAGNAGEIVGQIV